MSAECTARKKHQTPAKPAITPVSGSRIPEDKTSCPKLLKAKNYTPGQGGKGGGEFGP